MSTIASPREPSVTGRRIPMISTPTSSSRPSLDCPHSTEASPICANPSALPKRNRAALREYYNIKASAYKPEDSSLINDAASEVSSIHDFPQHESGELDQEDFDKDAYVKMVLEQQSLTELLTTYSAILGDIRALDAERKALVYDNYSKLIAATETIGRMRESIEEKEPVASTLNVVIEGIYSKAEGLRRTLEGAVDAVALSEKSKKQTMAKRAKDVVTKLLDTPEMIRKLVKEGHENEAREVWESARLILTRWKEQGTGGSDVLDCIEDGEAALRGEPPNEKSWANVKYHKEWNT